MNVSQGSFKVLDKKLSSLSLFDGMSEDMGHRE